MSVTNRESNFTEIILWYYYRAWGISDHVSRGKDVNWVASPKITLRFTKPDCRPFYRRSSVIGYIEEC